MTPGKHTLLFDFKSDGRGFGKDGTGVLKVDNTEVANQKIPNTIPALMPWDETFDVGVDTRTGVEDRDYQVPFAFNGEIAKLTVNLQPQRDRRNKVGSFGTQRPHSTKNFTSCHSVTEALWTTFAIEVGGRNTVNPANPKAADNWRVQLVNLGLLK